MSDTVIGDGLHIDGELRSADTVVVHGSIKGTVSGTAKIVVEAGGAVAASVIAESLTVAGQVTGDVTATDRVELRAGGRLVGNVKAARLTLADGAAFIGNVDMGT